MASDCSQKPLELSNEQMFKSIKVSMEKLVVEVSVMAEILEVLQQDSIKEQEMEMT